MQKSALFFVVPAIVLMSQGAFAQSIPAVRVQMMNKSISELNRLSEKDLNKTFDIKNAKGESIRNKMPSTKRENEKGLWATGDSELDKVEGTSTDKIYKKFKVPAKGKPVIVAVIDSGVDINHEDLQGKIWHNPNCQGAVEVVDDGDGYKNSCYGWNFLGGFDKNGKIVNVGPTTLEVTREYVRLKKLSDAGTISAQDAAVFEKVKADFLSQRDEKKALYDRYLGFEAAYKLLKQNGLTTETEAAVNAIPDTTQEIKDAKALVIRLLARKVDSAYVAMAVEELGEGVKYQFNENYDPYTAGSPDAIVNDNPSILNEKGYGNPDVIGTDASHGTHVSGIIAANRYNKLGINGQARNVQIMAIRAVPNGDERDKDVANAIYFAVYHGAQVINMSFGKAYSPDKSYVDKAMTYAASKGVILVHAAGNDGKNTESATNNFPNKKLTSINTPNAEVSTWLEIGASSKNKDATLPATFSNYGKTSVDLFAPGVDIVSTTPGNKYASYQGTSMASPEVAGVAALLLNMIPNAKPENVKKALLESVTTYPGLTVNQPTEDGDAAQVSFSSLSATGGVVNAYNALLKLQTLH